MARFNGWRLTRAGIVFIIVVALLAVAVFAGLKYAQQRGEQVRRDEAAEIARETQDQPTPAIAEEETPAPTTTGETGDGSGSDVAVTTPSAPTPAATATPAPSALPATGPSDVASIFVAAVLAYSVALYVSSRRQSTIN